MKNVWGLYNGSDLFALNKFLFSQICGFFLPDCHLFTEELESSLLIWR